MKIRRGLVSNSSSSSFILVVAKEDYEAALENVHPHIRHAVQNEVHRGTNILAGTEVIVAGRTVNSEDDFSTEGYSGEEYLDDYGGTYPVPDEDGEDFDFYGYDPWPAGTEMLINMFTKELDKMNIEYIYAVE